MIRLSGLEPEKDIPIEFIGFRPGEKLREKLTWDYEVKMPTEHAQIFMVSNRRPDKDALLSDLDELKKAAAVCDDRLTLDLLNRMCESHLNYRPR